MRGDGTLLVKTKDGWEVKMPYYTPYLENGTKKHPVGRSWKFDMWEIGRAHV
jgi:hypothetical protein